MKLSTILNYFIIILTVVFVNCDKGWPAAVTGVVTFRFSGLPVEGAKIQIMQSHHRGTEYQISGGTTDKNGKFKIWYGKTVMSGGYTEILRVNFKDSLYDYQTLSGRNRKMKFKL